MEYFFDRNESMLLVKTNPQKFSDMKKLSEILMPEVADNRGVGFSAAGLMSLNDFMSYTTEKDMLYFVFFLFKAMNEWADKSDSKLNLILDTNAIFYDQKKNRFCFAATTEKNDVNAIEFATNLVLNAVFKEKELQTAVELISFIRASIHTNARDILLFLEMSKYGRSYTSDWTKFKKTFENVTTGQSESLADAHKGSKTTHKVNNSMDFSDFLSVDDLFSDADSYVEEPAPAVKAEEPEKPEKKVEEVSYVEKVPVKEPETVTFIEEVQEEETEVPFIEEVQEEETEVPFIEEVQEEETEVPFIEEVQEEETEDVPFIEEVQEEETEDVPFIEEVQDEETEDVPFIEEVQEEEPEVPFIEEVQKEEPADVYPVSYDVYDDSNDEDQTMILDEEDEQEETIVAYLKGSDGTIVEISKDYFIIGRNSKESDFAVRDSSMSRKHAAIIRIDNEFYIEDLNSTNKTYLDNEQIMPHVRKLLSDGSVIFVSRNKYIFNVERR